MSFISLNFVVLFACTFILYHTLPSRFRKATLLTASCLFIGFYHLTFLITALILTLTTFYLGKWIGQTKRESSMKGIYFSGVCFLVVSWLAFRYADRLTDCHILFRWESLSILPGHFVPDRNLLARRRTGKEPARLHDIHALLHEVPFRSHRKSK